MKILFLNEQSKEVLEEFYAQNWQVDVFHADRDDLSSIIQNYDGLVIDAESNYEMELLAQADKLKVIGVLNKDIFNLDTQSATSLGITIVNISKSIASSIAEYTIGQMLYLSRLRRKKNSWELAGKTLGIIGFNQVSAALAKKARAMDMQVCVYDPALSAAKIKAHKIENLPLIDLLISADFLSINISLTDTAFQSLGTDQLSLCKENCVLINNSAPENITKEAIDSFLASSKMHFCAFDCPKSSLNYYDDFKNSNQLILSENKSTDTIESIRRGARELASEMLSVIQTGMSENAINIPIIANDKMPLYSPFLKMAAALGYFMGQYLNYELKEITLYDYEHSLDDAPIMQHLLQYLLTAMNYENINYVNALSQAFKLKLEVYINNDLSGKGLGLKIRLKNQSEHYLNLVFSENTIKINTLDHHQLNFELKEHMLLIYHADKPGVVGLVGSMLGACSINIIDMNLDNSLSPTENALMILTLDSKVDDDFIKVLSKYDNIYEVYYINLPSSIYEDFTFEKKSLI